MDKVKAWVLRDFHVRVAPETEGTKETKRRYRAGEEIECTPDQFKSGQDAGLLSDQPPTRFAEGESVSAPFASGESAKPNAVRDDTHEEE